MAALEALIERVTQTQHGFGDIRDAAAEVIAEHSPTECITLAHALYQSEAHQARALAAFIFGHLAASSPDCFQFLYDTVSQDTDWRVQEILAMAFDTYCAATGYEQALPTIEAWLSDAHPNIRRAASEGLRIWTGRPYFREHPETAIRLLSRNRADDSDYVRKSVGNALRDISRKHADRVRAELAAWDLTDKRILKTHKLASKFLTSKS